MSLQGSANYLALALEHERQVKNITLAHHQIGNLQLPTGALVACDPFVAIDAQPLTVLLLRGTFPVVLRIAADRELPARRFREHSAERGCARPVENAAGRESGCVHVEERRDF